MTNIAPPRDEQRAIVEFIRNETSSLSVTVHSIEREISLLREYRTRLIADVVTGKLDVREAAAGLPEGEETPSDAPEPDEIPVDEALEEAE